MSDRFFEDEAAQLVAALESHVTPNRPLRVLLLLDTDDLLPLLSPYFADMLISMPKAFVGVRNTALLKAGASAREVGQAAHVSSLDVAD